MKKLLLTAALAFVSAVGCAPDIEEQEAPGFVTANFDPAATPAVVPTPNDLVGRNAEGKLTVPLPANPTPVDQELVSYLNSLDGFPSSSAVSASFSAEVDPASVNTATVRVFEVTSTGLSDVTGTFVGYTAPANGAPARMGVRAPVGGWVRGHRYAVAVLGGANGVKDPRGRPVLGSAAWALVRSAESLVTCEDLQTACRPATGLIPSTERDPAARLADQTAKALRLEQVRRGYASLFAGLGAKGIAREDVALAWTFTIANAVTVAFEPGAIVPVVPTPNDVAIDPVTGLVNAPEDPTASAAQREFTRDYLNTLNGFPVTSTGSALVTGGDLDPATVSPTTVRFIDLRPADQQNATPVEATVGYDTASHRIVVTPPAAGWPKGSRFAVAVLGGPIGVKDTEGNPVAPSAPWILVRSKSTLVTCTDLADPSCAPALSATTLTAFEAVRLEKLRLGLKPLLDGLETQGAARAGVTNLWVFSVVNQPEPRLDLTAGVIPFPNDLLRDPTTGKVAFPNTAPLPPDLRAGLNTLDGFSTTAPIISENNPSAAALVDGSIKEETLAGNVVLLNATPRPGAQAPRYTVCLNCASSDATDDPQQLQIVPQIPLEEKSLYGAYVKTAVTDTNNRKLMAPGAFALLRLSSPIWEADDTADGRSLVNGVPDAQAQALEPRRAAAKPLFDALAAQNVPRSELALAWGFTTQSTVSSLQQLHALPGALPAAVSNLVADPAGVPAQPGVKFFAGAIPMPVAINSATGTFNPDPTKIAVQQAPFLLAVPEAASGNYPVVIFGHGLGRNRGDMVAIASSLTSAGYAVIATDVLFHGERSICVGASDPCATGTCDATPDSQTYGRCVGGNFRLDADGVPAISGTNYLNLENLFATRDNFRHQVADLAQLVRALKDPGFDPALSAVNGGTVTLDESRIHYVGQSLGGILGTLYTSASPDVHRAVLNVPGADPAGVLLSAPGFSAERAGFLAGLAAQGIQPGTPAFDQFIGIAKWIFDPADPQNAAYAMRNGTAAPADRDVLVQSITGDQVIPNPTTDKLVNAANRGTGKPVSTYRFTPPTGFAEENRHSFLLAAPTAYLNYTQAAQEQATTFLDDAAVTNPGL